MLLGIGYSQFEGRKNVLFARVARWQRFYLVAFSPKHFLCWQMFRNFSDDEIKAIFAFLKTTQPIHNIVPLPIPPATRLARIAQIPILLGAIFFVNFPGGIFEGPLHRIFYLQL